MEVLDHPIASRHDEHHEISFHGNGGQYFGIWIVNLLLTLVTVGLYYPWARAATMKYFWQETELAGSRFQFHGTGQEMFVGFIKAIGIVLGLYFVFGMSMWLGIPIIGSLVFFFGMLALIPIAIHGATRYRMSRTSWRGVHFGYRGDLQALVRECVVGGLLTLVTFGIYSFWLTCKIRQYVIGHIRFGNIQFEWRGRGGELFGITIAGYLLTILSLGIYSFWWMRDVFRFYIDNIHATQDGRRLSLRSTATGGGFFGLIVVNFLLLIFTLGLATPWVTVRTLEFVFHHIEIDGAFDPNSLRQTEEDYRDATGDDMADMLDLGIV